MEINGIAHVFLTVRDLARARPFYVALLEHMGLTRVLDSSDDLYYVGGRTAVGLKPACFDLPRAVSNSTLLMNHVCFRARSARRLDSSRSRPEARRARARATRRGLVPGYYSFSSRIRTHRLELNHVPQACSSRGRSGSSLKRAVCYARSWLSTALEDLHASINFCDAPYLRRSSACLLLAETFTRIA